MIYFVAIILSVAVCAQTVASGTLSGNITHLKNGRKPNAGVSIFPMIPLFQLLALGIAWTLEHFVPRFAFWILLGSFLALFVFWLMSYKRLKAELDRAMLAAKHDQSA